MTVTNKPTYPQSSKTAQAVVATAMTNFLQSADNLVQLIDWGTDGGECWGLWCVPRITNAANAAFLYSSQDAGATKHLIAAISIAADTFSAADAPLMVDFTTPDAVRISKTNPLTADADDIWYVGIGVTLSDGFEFHAMYGEL